MADQELWGQVDQYLEATIIAEPPVIFAARKASKAAGLPDIAISPAMGKWLGQIVAISGARRVLELGTLGGYSTLWMASALREQNQSARLVTLEKNPVCAGVAKANFAYADMMDIIELRRGEAVDSLKALIGEKGEPFDLVFLDANKADYPEYLKWVMRLVQKGSIIIADNVVREGAIIDENSSDYNVQGIQQFHKTVGDDKRLEATAIQCVNAKGYDGFSLIRVLE